MDEASNQPAEAATPGPTEVVIPSPVQAATPAPAPVLAPQAAPVETQHPVTLDEFCTRLSKKVREPELIAVFHHLETAAGRKTGLTSEYRRCFEAVASRPAK